MPDAFYENSIAKAAAVIRQIHRENIALIDSGHIFTRDGVDVSGEIKQLSEEQIVLCNIIIMHHPAQAALQDETNNVALADVIRDIEEIKAKRLTPDELPEIGNYGHEKS
jgi:hypothetical protein